jgi:hypothetical protein
MRRNLACFIILTCFFLTGCGNLSPRDNLNPKLQQDINNQQGRIDRIENNQNAIHAEIERISLINRENNNSGVQILQGDGALVLIFGLVTISLMLYYFYKTAENERKTSEILAEQIVRHQDNELESNVLKAAENTEVEKNICNLVQSKKAKLIRPKN